MFCGFSPLGNMARKQFFLVCLPLANMATKQFFVVCPASGNMSGIKGFLHLRETSFGDIISRSNIFLLAMIRPLDPSE